jgi:Ni/Co efflux regulator RcnB
MQNIARSAIFGLALAVSVTGASVGLPAWADPPGGFKNHEGHGRGHDHDRDNDGRSERGGHPSEAFHFPDHDRAVVHAYFSDRTRKGCPPGLAKKHNGCLPPGQAKRWRIGYPLPRDVIYYNLPPTLVVQLTPPPAGYRYVRVASDILMIAAGTGMVAAAIEDLGR